MRIVVLSVLVIFMSCSTSKSTVGQFVSKEFDQKNIISNFDKAIKTGLKIKINHQDYESIVNHGPIDNSYNVRSFENNIINLRKNDNFILLKNDSIFLRLYSNSSDRFIFKGKTKIIDSYYSKKNKAQVFKYKIDENNVKFNLLVSYFENKNVNIKMNDLMLYKGTWKEYEKVVR